MNLGFVFNVRKVKPSLREKQAIEEAEFDTPETIRGIAKALKKLGHKVFLIEANESAYFKIKKLRPKIDIVFNIAEGLWGADREAQIPAMLEMLRVPYIGSKPFTQALCLHKAKNKEILLHYGIPTPPFQLFITGKEKLNKNLKFPLIIKPNYEGSSKGIFQNSISQNKKDFKNKIQKALKVFKQPILAEELLNGREFTVALIGNNPIEVLPPVELNFLSLPKNLYPIDSYEVKWIIDNPQSQIKTVICPAKIDKILLQRIKEVCLKTKEALEVLDWCRIDLRLNKNNIPNILEVNQIPGIIPDPKENSRFPLAARAAGYTYEQMLEKIIKAACQRYKIC